MCDIFINILEMRKLKTQNRSCMNLFLISKCKSATQSYDIDTKKRVSVLIRQIGQQKLD